MAPFGQQFTHAVQPHMIDGVGVSEIAHPTDIALVRQVTNEFAVKETRAGVARFLFRELALATNPLASVQNLSFVFVDPTGVMGEPGMLGLGPERPAVASGPGG